MAGVFEMFAQGYGMGNQLRQQRQEEQRRSTLGQLLGGARGATGADREAMLTQAYAVDPAAAMQAESGFGKLDEVKAKRLGQMASIFTSMGPEQRAQAWPTIRAELSQIIPGAQYPDQWDESLLPQAQAIAQQLGEGSSGGVQSTQIGDDGYFYTVDRATGKFVNSGVKASPSLRILEQEGQLPYSVVTGRGVPGQVVPLGGAPAAQGYAQPSSYNGQAPQTQFTGADGAPVNIDPNLPPQVQAAIRANEGQWAQAPDQSQANIQMPGQPKMSNAGLPGIGQPSVGPVRIPTAAEKAYQAELAKGQAESELAPIRAQAEADKTRLVEGVKASIGVESEIAGKDAERTRSADDTLALLDEAERLLATATGSGAGQLVDKAAGVFGVSTEGARATAALNTISGQLVAKMPRMEGPQSDKDVQMYKDMAGNLADASLPIETRMAAARQIRRLNLKYASGNATKPAGRLRFNPATGKIE